MQGMSSVRCAAGQLVTALWVVVPRLTFANSCLATVFYAVGMVMVCQNGHIGSRLKAMVVIPGAWTVGSVCGGITVISSSSHSSHSCGLQGTLSAQGFQGSNSCSLHCLHVTTSCKLVIMESGATTFFRALATSSFVTVTSTIHTASCRNSRSSKKFIPRLLRFTLL